MTLLYVRLFYCREVIYMPLIISYHVIFDTFNTYGQRPYDVIPVRDTGISFYFMMTS
ncbi:hypothetical protein [Wolbachia endosymbiont (group A) of Tiphia femorata]|uniref:hypothetical protein n=1 Tax=Wolbachia endosymbiont (group A) of Tiphia femorata TaxID=2954063 RepID=UPI00222F21F9|nr:hypothetical protein [Wolbachia endosymbiont (group A) of Tiphia femorata]